MANLWLKNLLGQIPATEKIEATRNQLIEEYKRFNEIAESDELAKYNELKAYVESEEFLNKKKELEAIKFTGSEEEKMLNEFKSLEQDKAIKSYFATLDSDNLKRFKDLLESEKLTQFNEMKQTVESGQIEEIKTQMNTDHKEELAKPKKLKALKKTPDIKKYFKLINSPQYKIFKEISESEKPSEFEGLKSTLQAFDYSQINDENKDEFQEQIDAKEKLTVLEKDNGLKTYLKFKESGNAALIEKVPETDTYNEQEALEIYINSEEYQEKLKATDWKSSDLFKLQNDFKALKKDQDIKFFFKFEKSPAYKNYIEIKDDDKLKRFDELKTQTEDTEFLNQVDYLKDDKKFEKTEEYKEFEAFTELENNENIKWYLSLLKEDRFKPLIEWETVFEDEFEDKLNDEIWTPMVFTGLMSINENFVIQGEKQFFTDGKNLQINNSELSIQTKKEAAKGKTWSAKNGFMEQDFNYTSGTLNTAKAFRFNQGKIEAKVNIQQANNIIHGLSLKGEKITPHIDLIKTGKGNGYEVRYIPANSPKSIISHKVKGININDKYFIHALEWTEKELIWSLNGIEVARETHQLNGQELYINMASILEKTPESLPADFKIDWIKVYKKQQAE